MKACPLLSAKEDRPHLTGSGWEVVGAVCDLWYFDGELVGSSSGAGRRDVMVAMSEPVRGTMNSFAVAVRYPRGLGRARRVAVGALVHKILYRLVGKVLMVVVMAVAENFAEVGNMADHPLDGDAG